MTSSATWPPPVQLAARIEGLVVGQGAHRRAGGRIGRAARHLEDRPRLGERGQQRGRARRRREQVGDRVPEHQARTTARARPRRATASCAGWMRMGRPRSRSQRAVLGGGRDPLDDGVERVGRGAGGPLRQEVEGPGVESQVVHANPSFAMTGASWASRDRRRHFVA